MLAGQLMFDGLAMGLVFVLLATGLVLIASVNRILFMAYGMFYTIGAYATWWIMHTLTLPYFASLILAVIFAAAIGMLCQLALFNPLMKKEGGFLATLIASMGLLNILSQGDLLVFGTVARSIPTVFPGVLHISSLNMPVAKMALIIIGVVVTLLLFFVYEKTGFGRAMRTVAFLPEVASLQGINVNRIYIPAVFT